MTVAAVYAIIADMMFVAELNRLLAWKISLSVIRGPVEFEQQPDNQSDEEERAKDGDLRNEVRASIKDLPHRPLSSERSGRLRPTTQHGPSAKRIFQFCRNGVT